MSILENSTLKQIGSHKMLLSAYHLYRSLIGKPVISSSVNEERKIVFVHNPKVAGTSLRRLLGLKGDISHFTPGLLVPKKLWEDYFVIVAVREPVERLVSSYNYHTSERYNGFYLQKYPDIRTWSLETYFQIFGREPFGIIPQVNYLRHPLSDKKPDFVIRYENLEPDVTRLLSILHMNEERLPLLNDSARRAGRVHLISNRKLLDKVIDFYREDYRQLDYPLPVYA